MAISITLISYTAGDDDDTEDDDDVDDGYVMLPPCSQLSPHSHFVYSPGFFGYMKKIEERMKKVNGKPYLRTKIALRVIVWWPFCDFFKENLIPALVKVTIGQKRKRKDMREKVENRFLWQRRISIDVTFPKEKVHIFFWTPPLQLQF